MSSDYRTNLPAIDDATDKKITDLLSGVAKPDDGAGKPESAAAKPTAAEMLTRIRARRDKIPLSSSTTDRILGICTTLLGFGAAGLGLSVGFLDKLRQLDLLTQKIIVAAGIVYFELVLVSLIVLVLYVSQARFRYPYLYFKKIGNTWPWFYYATVSPEVSRNPFQGREARLKAAQLFASDFEAFSQKAIAETKADELRNELQQYYLLIAYQGYAHQFSLRLTNFFLYGLIGSIAAGVFLAVLVLFS